MTDVFYGDLPDKLYKLLCKTGKTVSTAESCTGGMIGETLTSIAGISKFYGYGVVTYSNEAKQKLIGVKAETLNRYGAVSYETACEMSQGVLKLSGADIGVSSTGIAGPGGGTKQKPVGLVYISLSASDGTLVKKELILSGSRESVRRQTVKNVLEMIIDYLEQNV